jgi:hypothetical protein
VRMGEAGRRRVLDRFTWVHTVERCLDAYSAALSPRQARSGVAMTGGLRG